jgi:16S rRNA (adenine1518-N6/adenine1519-N6)-dimethyltransferase
VVCNLPYSVSTPVIVGLLETDLPIRLMVLTVQKEVGERLAAHPGTKAYGALSVITQAHAKVKLLRTLPPDVFWPRPKVSSAIMRLTPTGELLDLIADYDVFRTVTGALFAFRRKTLPNSLSIAFQKQITPVQASDILRECRIDPARRGESLDMGEIITLANAMSH